uniref:Capsid protein n=1 Tax=Cressdnaviricota sp. TaxID=2748378 RepID=A0A7G8LJ22_9VIRU|nr:capsid protein [Cressdnaviricota sp.]
MFSRGYSYRRYRNARSSGTYSSRRSSIRSRSTGNTRAARAQRDSATVVINRIAPFNVYIYGEYYKASLGGTTFGAIAISHWDELRKSQFFPNYSSMYDQMRLDKTRIKITGSSAVSNDNPYDSPSIILAFDRNGLNSTQFVKLPNSQVPSSFSPVAFPDPNLVSTYSSSQTRQWSSGNSFSMYQTVYPSTIQEKGQYIATGALVAPVDPSTITGNIPDSEFSNPCSFWQHQSYPFKPITLLAVRLPQPVQTNNTYIFNIEFEFTVTFRGMRKPGIAASSKSLQNDLLLTPFSDTIVSNGIVHVTPDEVSSSAKGFSSIDINVNVPQESAPDPDIQPHTITLTDLNFPKTFEIDAEEPDAPDGWNPITIQYSGPPPSPTSCNLGERTLSLSDLNFPKTFRASDYIEGSNPGFSSFTLTYPGPLSPIRINRFYYTDLSDLSTHNFVDFSGFSIFPNGTINSDGTVFSAQVPPHQICLTVTGLHNSSGDTIAYLINSFANYRSSSTITFKLSFPAEYIIDGYRFSNSVKFHFIKDTDAMGVFIGPVYDFAPNFPVLLGGTLSFSLSAETSSYSLMGSSQYILPASAFCFPYTFVAAD